MRHRNKVKKLGRTAEHRHILIANLAKQLIEHERITTTLAKAKALRPFIEKLVTRARVDSLHNRRILLSRLKSKSKSTEQLMYKLIQDIGPRNANRPGGYTRIYKLGHRRGDAAKMALIEFVERTSVLPAKPEPQKDAEGNIIPEKSPAKLFVEAKRAASAAKKAAAPAKAE